MSKIDLSETDQQTYTARREILVTQFESASAELDEVKVCIDKLQAFSQKAKASTAMTRRASFTSAFLALSRVHRSSSNEGRAHARFALGASSATSSSRARSRSPRARFGTGRETGVNAALVSKAASA